MSDLVENCSVSSSTLISSLLGYILSNLWFVLTKLNSWEVLESCKLYCCDFSENFITYLMFISCEIPTNLLWLSTKLQCQTNLTQLAALTLIIQYNVSCLFNLVKNCLLPFFHFFLHNSSSASRILNFLYFSGTLLETCLKGLGLANSFLLFPVFVLHSI